MSDQEWAELLKRSSETVEKRKERIDRELSGSVFPMIETAYGRTVDHGLNIRIF